MDRTRAASCIFILVKTHSPTFVPQAAIPISHFPRTYLREVEDTDTEPDIMQNAVCVLLVQIVCYGLLWGKAKLCWLDSDGVLNTVWVR